MKIVETGVISSAEVGTARACINFGTVTILHNGDLLATYRVGDNKDSDQEQIEFARSHDNGRSWSKPTNPFIDAVVDGQLGTLKLCYLTELSADHLLAAVMWVDRTAHPGMPLFNAKTEGCLPMEILLADSHDGGATWTSWRKIPMSDDIGPPSLTNPILKLADGSLAMSIETNKHYYDTSKWRQRAVLFQSFDNGRSWSETGPIAEDTTARVFNWDLRCGVGASGSVATFAWTYDINTQKYLNIHRRISTDNMNSWSAPLDLGFADQAGPPAMLSDGRVVLAWVDRFGGQCIRARISPAIDAPFDPKSEVLVYQHPLPKGSNTQNTGDLLAGMEMWSFGLPFAVHLPDDDVLIAYYAGNHSAMDLHFARLVV